MTNIIGPHFNKRGGRVWYVDTINGNDGNLGRTPDNTGVDIPGEPFKTMARAFVFIDSLDEIRLVGVVKEQIIAPAGVFDITLRGMANRPRQATASGVPTGGGSTWTAPASPTATTSLLALLEQGWQIENIQFKPHTSSACITIQREGSTPEKDSSHTILRRCRFVGGTTANGILFLNGGYNCLIEDNEFESLAGTAILSSGTAVAIPLNNKILRNRFTGCANAIAISSSDGRIIGNIFRHAVNSTNKINLVSVTSQGLNNLVLDNYLPDATANVTIAKGYKPGTGDIWRNWVTDAADPVIAVPS